jgi:hypothetical protein
MLNHRKEKRRICNLKESITIVSLIVKALEKLPIQKEFDKDPYESRRKELKGARLVNLMVIYQLIKSRYMRGLVRAVKDNKELEKAAGGKIALNTLSNALSQRSPEQMMAAWQVVLAIYGPQIAAIGKRFARISLIDSSLIKLSLAAFDWAAYRKKKGAAKMHMVLDWGRLIPQQLIITVGKVNDLNRQVKVAWQAGWTYVQDRGYVCFRRCQEIINAGAHFIVRLKQNCDYTIVKRREVDSSRQENGIRLRSDWTIRLVRWPDQVLRIVSYQLPDNTLIRVLTDRFDLSAASVAQLYKERWKIENWWKWVKSVFKIKEPIGRSQEAVENQIITALITDLMLRVFKQKGRFLGSLYEFVVRCQEASLVPLAYISDGDLRQAFELIFNFLFGFNFKQQPRAA